MGILVVVKSRTGHSCSMTWLSSVCEMVLIEPVVGNLSESRIKCGEH